MIKTNEKELINELSKKKITTNFIEEIHVNKSFE